MSNTLAESQPQRPLRVAYVTGSFAGAGTEHYLLRMLRHLDRSRFAPYVVTLSDSGELREETHALAPVYEVRLTGKLFNVQGLRELWRLRGWLRKERIELVHALADRAIIYGFLAARLAGNLPRVASHQYTVAAIGGGLLFLNNLMLRRFAHHVIPNSRAVVPSLVRLGIPPGHITVVHNGIPPDRLRPVVERPVNSSPLTICSVGRFSAVKALHLLVEAVAELVRQGCDVNLVLAGSGPEEPALRKQTSDLGIADRVTWTGYIADPTDVLQRSDVCALTSYNEGFPNVVVEYLAAGRPVVTTAVGGVPEIVIPEENGLLVPPGDVKALADALRRLVEDGELRRRMGRNGRALVEREFTAQREVEQTQAVYARLISQATNAS